MAQDLDVRAVGVESLLQVAGPPDLDQAVLSQEVDRALGLAGFDPIDSGFCLPPQLVLETQLLDGQDRVLVPLMLLELPPDSLGARVGAPQRALQEPNLARCLVELGQHLG